MKNYTTAKMQLLLKKVVLFCTIFSTVIAISGCNLIPKEEEILEPPVKEPKPVELKTVPVERGDVVKTIRPNGTFVSTSRVELSFDSSGYYFKEFKVNVGDRVSKGDVVAVVDTSSLEEQIEQEEYNLKKLRLDYAAAKFEGKDQFTLQKFEIDLKNQEEKLDKLKTTYENGFLISPIDGVVIDVNRNIREGDLVEPNSRLAVVADLDNVFLEITNDDKSQLKLGQKCEVYVANKGPYEGEVISTPDMQVGDGAAYIKVKDLPVMNTVAGQKSSIVNSYGSIVAVVDERKNVIRVSKGYVKKSGKDAYVYVLENGVKTQRMVKLGLEGNQEYEILEGLDVGDLIVID